ncbi:unnamed protein product, partial [Amoebophrya sp. A25]
NILATDWQNSVSSLSDDLFACCTIILVCLCTYQKSTSFDNADKQNDAKQWKKKEDNTGSPME